MVYSPAVARSIKEANRDEPLPPVKKTTKAVKKAVKKTEPKRTSGS